MKNEKDARFIRECYIRCIEISPNDVFILDKEGHEPRRPEIVRRFKFAVNLLDSILEQPTTYTEARDLEP